MKIYILYLIFSFVLFSPFAEMSLSCYALNVLWKDKEQKAQLSPNFKCLSSE